LAHLQLKISLAGDPLSFTFLPRQLHQNGTLTVAKEDATMLTSYRLPQTNPVFAEDLVATPFLQSNHERLRTQVQHILGAEQDAMKATHLLLGWTYNTLAKEPSVGIPTALEALDMKKGDCNEHAVLFTALARAAGIPSRVAAGVVYLNGAFYYHAWSEVWLGQWVSVDPVFNQFPADATHIKFIQGGPEEHLALLKVIGQVGMEVISGQ
jgi:transglutaminase-like putative cysteine protease